MRLDTMDNSRRIRHDRGPLWRRPPADRGPSPRLAWAPAALFALACAGSVEGPPAASGGPLAEPAVATSPPGPQVAEGETACILAGRYAVEPEALLRVNGLTGPADQRLAAGTWLRLPDAAPLHHRTRQGETLSRLARWYGVPVVELARANGIEDPDALPAGFDLRVPRGAATGCPPAPPAVGAPRAPDRAERSATQGPPASAASAEALIAEARGRYDAADFRRAIELSAAAEHALDGLPDAGRLAPQRARCAWIAGLSWTGLDRPEEAVDRFRDALALDPDVAGGETISPRVERLVERARRRETGSVR